jgi:hypothetical protein
MAVANYPHKVVIIYAQLKDLETGTSNSCEVSSGLGSRLGSIDY